MFYEPGNRKQALVEQVGHVIEKSRIGIGGILVVVMEEDDVDLFADRAIDEHRYGGGVENIADEDFAQYRRGQIPALCCFRSLSDPAAIAEGKIGCIESDQARLVVGSMVWR